MTLHDIQRQLLEVARLRIRSGSETGRRLARRLGVSQPHLHNVLRGTRGLTIELADQMLRALELNLADLLGAGTDSAPMLRGLLGPGHPFPEVEHMGERYPFPAGWMARLHDPAVVRLAADPELEPLFRAADLVLLDRGPEARAPLAGAWYAIAWNDSGLLRRLEGAPGRWQLAGAGGAFVSEPKQLILEVLPADLIRARAGWIGRELE